MQQESKPNYNHRPRAQSPVAEGFAKLADRVSRLCYADVCWPAESGREPAQSDTSPNTHNVLLTVFRIRNRRLFGSGFRPQRPGSGAAELKNAEKEIHAFRLRLTFAGAVVLACFMILLARFVHLQVVRYDEYQSAAEDNRISVLPIVPNRGLILDRNGVVLAHNFAAYTLEDRKSVV